MGWIKSDYRFPSRSAVLRIGRKTWDGRQASFEELMRNENPDFLEAALRLLIEEANPSFTGCLIFFFRYDAMMARWEIDVEHPSLPHVELGSRFPVEWLATEEEDNVQPSVVLQANPD